MDGKKQTFLFYILSIFQIIFASLGGFYKNKNRSRLFLNKSIVVVKWTIVPQLLAKLLRSLDSNGIVIDKSDLVDPQIWICKSNPCKKV
jgi:hypothetical protein